MAASSVTEVSKKAVARVAFIRLDSSTNHVLRDCFRQFGIEVVTLDEPARLHKEKFDAAVIWLNDEAESFLKEARESRSNRRVVIFGVCGGIAEAIRFSKYGINVLLEKPVDRQSALRAVRATHLLIINEFRRYVRIPIVVKIEGVSGMQHITGNTEEVSGGGMSLRYKGKLAIGDELQSAFDLPSRAGIKVKGVVCWVRPSDSSAGIRFEPPEQPGRDLVRKWIDDYLDIS
ncbi:MAG TPA: PilZ domain-containing protein [Terriglobales bacterium]|nr:PilZ domain-containing protein [Terriglobales bacterium]